MTAVRARWGGEFEAEAHAAASAVQRAMQLCSALACDMRMVAPTVGKEMESCDVTAGVSFIKPGDSTPVTAADFAIQGLVSAALKEHFPNDRFMGEEDAADLRADPDLCDLALDLCTRFGGDSERDAFLAAVDRGLEPERDGTERVWVLDPIDGTKGFMTGQGYVIGLALLVDGEAVVGAMGAPNENVFPPLMVSARGQGLRWWPREGEEPLDFAVPRPEWADRTYQAPPSDGPAPEAGVDYPPWLLSPQTAKGVCAPFGPQAGPSELCCGAMIKYFAVAAGRASGFLQFQERLKTWDHACGVICVIESGGKVTDGAGKAVVFPGRAFEVKGGVVCASEWAPPEVCQQLLAAAAV